MHPIKKIAKSEKENFLHGFYSGNTCADLNPQPMSRFRLSPFLCFWRIDEGTVVFNSLKRTFFLGDSSLFKILSLGNDFLYKLNPEVFYRLFYLGLILHEKDDSQLRQYNLLRENGIFFKNDIKVMYLLMNHTCNLRCSYCVFNPNPPETFANPSMTFDTAKKSVELFSRLVKGDGGAEIIFYGGEPLLSWPVIEETVRYLRASPHLFGGKSPEIEVFTNATLINDVMADFFVKFALHPVISIDGDADIHNLHRTDINGCGSFEAVFTACNLLKAKGIVFSIGCTVGRHNSKNIERVLAFFKNNFPGSPIRFYAVKGLSGENSYELSGRELFDVYREIEKNAPDLSTPLTDSAGMFSENRCSWFACDGFRNQIAVMPSGIVGPCVNLAEDLQFYWGSLADVDIEERINCSAETKKLMHLSPFYRTECFSCPAISFCGGACFHSAFVKRGDISSLDGHKCDEMREIVKYIVVREALK